ncbi:retrovirus-related pol polyprotein from transposon TNT 1-94 [Tanacetum coccineum]
MEKVVLTLIHKSRSLRTIFQTYKVSGITDDPMEKMQSISGTNGRLAKWIAGLRTYHVSYVQRKEAERKMVKRFFGQREQVLQVPDKNNDETFRSREKTHRGLSLTTRAWRLYVRRELNKEGSDNMDYEELLVGLVASARRNMKDLHVSVDSKVLVDQEEGSRIPRTKEAKRYREEIMDAIDPFHKFRITYLPKALNPKAEALTGLASIQLELLNQEVSVGIKTRTLVEV